jgi:hypothetical protein
VDRPGKSPGGSRGDEVPVERIRSGGHGATLTTAAVIVVAIAIAIVKPWGGSASGAAASPAPIAARETPPPSSQAAASPSAAASDPAADGCRPEGEWRLVMRESNAGLTVRTWYELTPDTAAGPADPTIPILRLYSEGVLSLGYCTSSTPAGGLSVAGTTVWRLTDGSAPERIGPMRLSLDSPRDADIGSMFVPPRAPDGSAETDWVAGRYVFEVSFSPPAARSAWFGVDIVDVHPVGTPDAGPGAGGPVPSPSATGEAVVDLPTAVDLMPTAVHVGHARLW